jgi:hypothetical protein
MRGLSTRHMHAFGATICLQDARCYHPGKENHVARSTRNDTQRQSAPKVEQGFRVPAERALCEQDSLAEPGADLDTLNLGHAGLRNECWPGTSAMLSSAHRSGPAAPRHATPRLRRPPRKRTPLHRSRPSQCAEARFIPDNREILTD